MQRLTSAVVLPASLTLLLCLLAAAGNAANETGEFTARDLRFLASFTLSELPALPAAPGNQYADNIAAARLGQAIFFDAGFSANGTVACATCHQPGKYFTDGLPRGQGIAATHRNTLSLLGGAYGPWKYWDGRKDSLWAQALEPLEHPNEQGFSRSQVYRRIVSEYRLEYENIFGPLPTEQQNADTRVFANVGKSLMAYQRRLRIPASRFDGFVGALIAGGQGNFSQSEVRGLRLFMGRAGCASCHNGPLFTNFEFHNVGAPEHDRNKVDLGRYLGVEQLRNDEFNCLSEWSDASKEQCAELNYLKKQGPELVGAFKTPSLRNVAATAPYMQAGQFVSLEAVVTHYNSPTPPFYDRAQHPSRPHFDILPLGLSAGEQNDLVAFLKTLTSPLPYDDPWWWPPSSP